MERGATTALRLPANSSYIYGRPVTYFNLPKLRRKLALVAKIMPSVLVFGWIFNLAGFSEMDEFETFLPQRMFLSPVILALVVAAYGFYGAKLQNRRYIQVYTVCNLVLVLLFPLNLTQFILVIVDGSFSEGAIGYLTIALLFNLAAAVLQTVGIVYGMRWLRIRPSEIAIEDDVPIAVPVESGTVQPNHSQPPHVQVETV
eukprot:gb/GECG01004046.1/.p1 GENE.gb/GECG01004046.1/~~gb/GECG01004046.1/.p1  ORF type:complete len:201 (+),score=18.18 gb/GECG01004046.1/:1-603(+)